jgi:site-specific recombinase XerD
MVVSKLDVKRSMGTVSGKKNRLERLVVWDRVTNELLKTYLLERAKLAKTDRLFINQSKRCPGGKISSRTIIRVVKNHRVKGRRVVPHSFRSGLITDMLEANVNPIILQEMLGHTSILSLKPYARVTNQQLVKVYRKNRG